MQPNAGFACEALLAVTDAEGHDSATLKGFVEETLKDYCLIDDAPSITYDNVTSNVSAFDHSSGSCLDELGGTRCLAHVLQLGVKAIFQLPEWSSAMPIVREATSWMGSNNSRRLMKRLHKRNEGLTLASRLSDQSMEYYERNLTPMIVAARSIVVFLFETTLENSIAA